MVGMTVAHLGLGIFVLGVTLVESQTVERDIALRNGESTNLAGYVFTYHGGENIEGPNYAGYRGHVTVTRNGRLVAQLAPEKRQYWVQNSVMTEAGIAHTITENSGNHGGRANERLQVALAWLGEVLQHAGRA